MSAARSSYLNLYSSADVSDDNKKARMAVGDTEIDFSAAQEIKFDFGAYKFKKADDSYFALEGRFAAIETDSSAATNAAAITQLQSDLAGEQTGRVSGDTANGNLITSETAARTGEDQLLQQAIAAEAVTARAAESAAVTAIQQEVSDRNSAVVAERSRAEGAEASLQTQINNVLSNDTGVIDSISELLNSVNAEDANLLALISTVTTGLATLKDRVDALTA